MQPLLPSLLVSWRAAGASPTRQPTRPPRLQVGSTLRQRFLRTLHPLQVVELPRQKPDAALQLFAPVAVHTRVLVVGGDGSGEARGARLALPALQWADAAGQRLLPAFQLLHCYLSWLLLSTPHC